MSHRIGHGFDVHAFSADPDRRLVIGGVLFPGERGLIGHSDADVLTHAVIDALLSPAGLGDIGELFPDTDPDHAGADSMELLAEALVRLQAVGGSVVNIDTTIVAEQPKIAPKKAAMQARMTEAVGAPVTIKGKRAESLGAIGRTEGIACWAIALIEVEA